jgi:hypothetical protein
MSRCVISDLKAQQRIIIVFPHCGSLVDSLVISPGHGREIVALSMVHVVETGMWRVLRCGGNVGIENAETRPYSPVNSNSATQTYVGPCRNGRERPGVFTSLSGIEFIGEQSWIWQNSTTTLHLQPQLYTNSEFNHGTIHE